VFIVKKQRIACRNAAVAASLFTGEHYARRTSTDTQQLIIASVAGGLS